MYYKIDQDKTKKKYQLRLETELINLIEKHNVNITGIKIYIFSAQEITIQFEIFSGLIKLKTNWTNVLDNLYYISLLIGFKPNFYYRIRKSTKKLSPKNHQIMMIKLLRQRLRKRFNNTRIKHLPKWIIEKDFIVAKHVVYELIKDSEMYWKI